MTTLQKTLLVLSSLITGLIGSIILLATFSGVASSLDLGPLLPNITWRTIVLTLISLSLMTSSAFSLRLLDKTN